MSKATKPILLAALLIILIVSITVQVWVRQVKALKTQAAACCSKISGLENSVALAESSMGDWAGLQRYAEANAMLQPSRKGELRVVFVGDSITDNWDDVGYGGFFPGKLYINRGISGQTTQQMLARFRQDVIALNPQAVVILAGTNDLRFQVKPPAVETATNNLASMAELARLHKIRVILASVLPVSDYNHLPDGRPIVQTSDRPPVRIIELNNWIKDYAARNGFTYLDYYGALSDEKGMLRAEFSADGLHPNAYGYAVMAPLAEQAIEKSLAQQQSTPLP
jgi:lysophospholipase L1-like esterase